MEEKKKKMKLMSNLVAGGGGGGGDHVHLKSRFKSLFLAGYFLLLQILGGVLVAGNAILRGKREEEGGGGGAETSASGLPRYKTLSKNCYPKNMPFFLSP